MERELRNFKVNWDWSRISLLDSNPGDYSSHRLRKLKNCVSAEWRAKTIPTAASSELSNPGYVRAIALRRPYYRKSPAESLPGCQHTNRDIESLHQPKRASHTQREEKRWKQSVPNNRGGGSKTNACRSSPATRTIASHFSCPTHHSLFASAARGSGSRSAHAQGASARTRAAELPAPSTRGDVESAHAWDPLCPSVIANQRSRRALSAASRRSFPIPRN
ncbi:hypothetical protein BKA62DRAFT_761137 [Auriculariales sp. MPI-PUGE-AT-0066]|nr:hypothetical protein BKA62DRAFT_761137 [Auriculariales sp. MPI-PUGE-AT-0066]